MTNLNAVRTARIVAIAAIVGTLSAHHMLLMAQIRNANLMANLAMAMAMAMARILHASNATLGLAFSSFYAYVLFTKVG